jgi:hypothetical protein
MTKHIQMRARIANGIRVAGAAVALIGSLALTACGGGGGGDSAPPPPACQTNNTANVSFRNSSATGLTMDIRWDGVIIERLFAGQTGLSRAVSAGVAHTLVFVNAANGANACTPATPNLAQCTSSVIFCSA